MEVFACDLALNELFQLLILFVVGVLRIEPRALRL
jgi:hypothetical protein